MGSTTYNRYILNDANSSRAIEQGLAEADWYTCPISKAALRKLLERRDGPALRDTIMWFALLGASGYAGYLLWGTWWAIIPFLIYGVIYASTSDSRWHESSHGTAFRTDWLNNALYEVASFMVMRESTVWRWSHTRHHSDTIIVGRDPEIAVPRPPDLKGMILALFSLNIALRYFRNLLLHTTGRLTEAEKTFIPASEQRKVFIKAWIYLLIYAAVIGFAVQQRSILPLMYAGLPNFYGAWLMSVYGTTQHAGLAEQKTYRLRVVSNHNVATFIKELVLEQLTEADGANFRPGDYMQLDIPAYGKISFRDFEVSEPYRGVWEANHVFDYATANPVGTRRNYSLAGNRALERVLRFNVRISAPPRGQECTAGVGSSYVWSLKPGDEVTAIGPFGDFHIKPGESEMIYLGGGAGMAPLRAHVSHLLETEGSRRKIGFWYGARSGQELFYQDYFNGLARSHPNFSFHPALSEPLPGDGWESHTGYIHEVLRREYLASHPDPTAAEYYLCGPPAMIAATRSMLRELGVAASRIAFDEF
jgi:fatty acid desaturase